ncbi:hypothetical protein MTR67_043829 [Solanum verrucosum]|uniref:Uncharacterized protein n=1 Tax=Solanum verrucosum TaxID=315347 RepID=A0AAF0USC5_SOLVR|nr:hypothetical protein MTR67_043829 [Solanum verrucosum]
MADHPFMYMVDNLERKK